MLDQGQRSLQVRGERPRRRAGHEEWLSWLTDASGRSMSSRGSGKSLGLRKAAVRPLLTPTPSKSGERSAWPRSLTNEREVDDRRLFLRALPHRLWTASVV